MTDRIGRALSRPEFIAIVAAMMALNALAIDIMLPALPNMAEALGVTSENERQFVITAYMLGFGAAQLLVGPLSDRFGRRAPLFIGIGVYVAAAIASAFSPDFSTLLVLRFIQGMGAAGTRVIAMSLVRDLYSGRAMAEIMSLTFMVFMVIPIVAPGIGQLVLLAGPWQAIFLFMGGLAALFLVWGLIRLPETLPPERRRPLSLASVAEGFRLVISNRRAFSYGLAGMFVFAALFGFISSAQQIYVDVYGLGVWFPLAFAGVAGLMAVSSFLNARIVSRVGMRRLSHGAMLVFIVASAVWAGFGLLGLLPFWLFYAAIAIIMFCFGLAAGNMNSLSMEPLGAVAGTASSVFGFIQTLSGTLIGSLVGQMFDNTATPTGIGFFLMGLAALACILIAENGRLFGTSEEPGESATAGAAH